MDRAKWRLVGPMHIAETREQALKDVEYAIEPWFDYLQHVAAAPHFEPAGDTLEERIDWVNSSGVGVIGTPEDAVAQIEKLWKQSNGGFGSYLMMAHEWVRPDAVRRHYELFAQWVMPHFTGAAVGVEASKRSAEARRAGLAQRQGQALLEATARHAANVAPPTS
jgi:limonene 1,2-monooxygenase